MTWAAAALGKPMDMGVILGVLIGCPAQQKQHQQHEMECDFTVFHDDESSKLAAPGGINAGEFQDGVCSVTHDHLWLFRQSRSPVVMNQ